MIRIDEGNSADLILLNGIESVQKCKCIIFLYVFL